MKLFKKRTYVQGPAIFVMYCLTVAAGFATVSEPVLPDPGKPRLTRDQQQKLGLQVAAEVYKQMPVLPDSSAETKYIQELGKRLYTTIPPEHSWPFQFHVVAQKEINAFALPGGPMFVNVGTIIAADNEAELAGVMAHEMSHVYMQHSAKQQEKSSLLGGLAGLAGAIAGSLGGNWGTLAESGIQFGAGTLMLKYSRADEAQADAVGAIILWKAGYNPEALADFFEKIAAQGGTGPQFLSDHPNPGDRRAAIQHEIAEWPTREYLRNGPEFTEVRKDATTVRVYSGDEIGAGAKSGRWAAENQKNGAVLPGGPPAPSGAATGANAAATVPQAPIVDVQPSSTFHTVDLGLMKIDHPENWDVVQGQQSGSVTIAPKAGVSGSAVAYGVVIQSVQVPEANMNPQQLTASIAQSLEAGDSNMKQSGEIQSITVNNASGGSVDLETVSPMPGADGKPQGERDWLVVVPRGQGQAVFLVFVSAKIHLEQIKPTFDKMLRSVQF
jgi:beta-barrel assembly-enhancing protease